MSDSIDTRRLQGKQHQQDHSHIFSDIYDKYQRPIYGYLLRLTENETEAEDLNLSTKPVLGRQVDSCEGRLEGLTGFISRLYTEFKILS